MSSGRPATRDLFSTIILNPQHARGHPGTPDLPKPQSSLLAFRQCTQCRRTIRSTSIYKTCEYCRLKSREKDAKKRARRRGVDPPGLDWAAFKEQASQAAKSANPAFKAADVYQKVKATKEAAQPAAVVSKKRKVEESVLYELEQSSEYQTGQNMLVALRDAMATFGAKPKLLDSRSLHSDFYMNFSGSFAVVMDPDIDEQRRSRELVEELRTFSKLKFGPLLRRDFKPSSAGYARMFRCGCDPAHTHPPFAAAGRTSSSAMGAALARNGVKGYHSNDAMDVDGPVPSGCGGTITVCAVVDHSHPLAHLGFKGQRMTVLVEHPGRSATNPFTEW